MNLAPIQFTREIALFPLPNCVLFPGVVQPLHIFEPRYRAMMQVALDDPGVSMPVLAMALLKPGWEKGYHGSPEIHPRVCAGRIIAHERLADGKYNLLLQGVARARVIAERPCAGEWGVYRMATLEEVPDIAASAAHQALERQVIGELFQRTALKDLTVTPALASLFEETVPMSRLIDALAFALVEDVRAKQRLLDESDVGARGEMLLRELVALASRLAASTSRPRSPWPPEPGVN